MTSSVMTKKKASNLPKVKFAPKKVMVTVWWSAAHLIHDSFLNPGETITSEKYAQQIDGMDWKLQCLVLALVNRKGPILHNAQPHVAEPKLQKSSELGYEVLSAMFNWSLLKWQQLLQVSPQYFAGKMLPQLVGGRKCFSRVHQIPKHGFLCYNNKQNEMDETGAHYTEWGKPER